MNNCAAIVVNVATVAPVARLRTLFQMRTRRIYNETWHDSIGRIRFTCVFLDFEHTRNAVSVNLIEKKVLRRQK